MGVEEVVFGLVRTRPADEVDAAQIIVGDGVVLDFGHHIAAVQEIGCPEFADSLACADALGVIGVFCCFRAGSHFPQLIEPVIRIYRRFIICLLLHHVPVPVVIIDGAASLAVFAFCLCQQPVVGVVGVDGGVGFRACDCHLAPVACSIIGVVDRQAVGLALPGQSA